MGVEHIITKLSSHSIKVPFFLFFAKKVAIMKLTKFPEIFIVYSQDDEKNVTIILGLF